MKVGIIGAGMVGSAAGNALALRGLGRELVFVDKDTDKAAAQAEDIAVSSLAGRPLEVSAGDYKDLAGAAVVVLAPGVSQVLHQSRLEMVENNAAILREVVPRVLTVAPDALLVVATAPVDAMTSLVARLAGNPNRVMGTGTVLETIRFRLSLAARLGVNRSHVHGFVIGEAGAGVIAWNGVDVAGMPLEQHLSQRGMSLPPSERLAIADEALRAGSRILEGKGMRNYGAGAVVARIVEAILEDRRAVMTVSALDLSTGVCHALPRIIGRDGVIATLRPELSSEESIALEARFEDLRRTEAMLK
jgi:L-lactate dehydrogenase